MKKILILAVALTISISSFSQKKEIDSKIIIAGNLKNYDAKEIRVNTGESGVTSSIKAGDFKITFEAKAAEIYRFWIIPSTYPVRNDPDKEKLIDNLKKHEERSWFELFLSPGDSIYLISVFSESNTSFKLAGNHIAENAYLLERRRILYNSVSGNLIEYRRNLYEYGSSDGYMAFMGLEKDQYLNKKDSLFNVYKSRFEVLKANNALDPEFVKLEEAYLEYQPILYDLQYPFYHAIIHRGIDETTQTINMDGIDFPIDKADLAKVDLNRSDLLSFHPYISVVKKRIECATKDTMKQDTTLKTEKARMMVIDQLLTNQLVKDQFSYNYIKSDLDYRGPAYVKVEYDKFMKDNQSPILADKLKESHDKWKTILPGMEVPDFTFVNMEGESVELSDLRGKLVYIDIWATWCGPCIAEHPQWDKLRDEYKDKAVSFLTISIDFKREPWEKMVKAKNMEGLQWYAPGDFKSELATHFMVNGIPRFILLDREGKIIDPSADRPSGDIRAMLDQHL
jgi:thiol-disulfide isomerase/thioredoxin